MESLGSLSIMIEGSHSVAQNPSLEFLLNITARFFASPTDGLHHFRFEYYCMVFEGGGRRPTAREMMQTEKIPFGGDFAPPSFVRDIVASIPNPTPPMLVYTPDNPDATAMPAGIVRCGEECVSQFPETSSRSVNFLGGAELSVPNLSASQNNRSSPGLQQRDPRTMGYLNSQYIIGRKTP